MQPHDPAHRSSEDGKARGSRCYIGTGPEDAGAIRAFAVVLKDHPTNPTDMGDKQFM